jgi:hypothetical protein
VVESSVVLEWSGIKDVKDGMSVPFESSMLVRCEPWGESDVGPIMRGRKAERVLVSVSVALVGDRDHNYEGEDEEKYGLGMGVGPGAGAGCDAAREYSLIGLI